VADEAIRRNYLKEDLGWISENLHLVTVLTLYIPK